MAKTVIQIESAVAKAKRAASTQTKELLTTIHSTAPEQLEAELDKVPASNTKALVKALVFEVRDLITRLEMLEKR